MATYNLRRFAHADGLKAIAREHLLALLKPHKPYFDGRGLTLPPPSASDGIDYDQLVNVLMNPDTDTPKGLLDALYFVHEMATPEAMCFPFARPVQAVTLLRSFHNVGGQLLSQ